MVFQILTGNAEMASGTHASLFKKKKKSILPDIYWRSYDPGSFPIIFKPFHRFPFSLNNLVIIHRIDFHPFDRMK